MNFARLQGLNLQGRSTPRAASARSPPLKPCFSMRGCGCGSRSCETSQVGSGHAAPLVNPLERTNWNVVRQAQALSLALAVGQALQSTGPSQAATLVSSSDVAGEAAAAGVGLTIVPVDPSDYTPGAMDMPAWQLWAGFLAGVIPFAIGAYEFGKRILIQLRCEPCNGRGLVKKGKYLKKCLACGGFFPWISWRIFLTSTAAPGNGGPLLAPRGQTSVFYTVPPPRAKQGGGSSAPPAAAPNYMDGIREVPEDDPSAADDDGDQDASSSSSSSSAQSVAAGSTTSRQKVQ